MFYYLCGKLTHLEPGFAVIDCGGVGYKLSISGTTYDAIQSNRSASEIPTVKLYTHLAVREDDIELFGFMKQTELATFKLLLTVSGVGPRAALSILPSMSPEKFAIAVCTDDKKTIARANGIGPKTAARVILELKDKLMKDSDGGFGSPFPSDTSVANGARSRMNEAIDAMIVLGYSRAEAMNALKDVDVSNTELQEIIRLALKKLMRP